MLVRVVIVAVMVLPLAAAFVAGYLADALGCSLNEAALTPCALWGLEVGAILYELFVLGWLSLITIPVSAVVLVAYEILRFVFRNHRAR